ncbi:MAG TPA: NfeD family protein [Phycisphaerales bacterium]|nr:NfeD family protein [Phycisphaerales bacterium]
MSFLFDDGMAWFTLPALIGTSVFLIRLLMMLVGGAADLDLDLGVDTDGLDLHSDSTQAFQVLSVQGVSAFLMGFGWTGFAAARSLPGSWVTPVLLGVAGGVGMVYVMGLALKGLYDLQSSGNIGVDRAVGAEGVVYVTVPPAGKGQGQVRVVVNDRDRIFGAVSEGEVLPTRSRVRVTRANGDNTVTVAPA